MVVFAVAVLIMASACADDTDNRQFASDPRTPQPTPTADASEPLPATPVRTARPVASPEALVNRRGTPDTVYGEIGGSLRAVTRAGAEVLMDAPVLAFAPSPSGHQVAVLLPRNDGAGHDIEIHTAEGELAQRIERVLAVSSATPVDASDASEVEAIALSWSPQGRSLLLAHSSGQLVDIHLDGGISVIETRTTLAGLTEARWSPRGDQIGVVFRDEDGFGTLALVDPGNEPARVNVIAPVGQVAGQRASVEQFAWKPHGDGVLFLQGNPTDDGVRNGQIVAWDQATNSTQVMATGGQLGPTGSIRSFIIAPDGKAVAYTIDIRTPDGWEFGDLYVRSLTIPQVYRVPVGPDVAVTAVWWLGDGLAWAGDVEDEGADQTILVRWIDAAGTGQAIAHIVVAPQATPAASPVASPASPVASPAATPVEGATPVD